MRLFPFIVSVALGFAGTSRADVVIYKGTATCLQPNDTAQFGKTPRLYYIVDLSTHESYPLFYFTPGGKKKVKPAFPVSPTYYNAAPGFNGKTMGVFNIVLACDPLHTQAANNFSKPGATVYLDILAELSAKGYQ